MSNNIIIKAKKSGLSIYLSDKLTFDELLLELRNKFAASKKFFGATEMVLMIEGRTLSEAEINRIVNAISDETELNIISVIDNEASNDSLFQKKLQSVYDELDDNACEVHPSSLCDGASLDFKHSVIILGDVLKGCEVHTNGSVFILGSCLGRVYAGELGNRKAKVYAGTMEPEIISIADVSFNMNSILEERTVTIKKKGLFRKIETCAPKAYMLYLDENGECAYQAI